MAKLINARLLYKQYKNDGIMYSNSTRIRVFKFTLLSYIILISQIK